MTRNYTLSVVLVAAALAALGMGRPLGAAAAKDPAQCEAAEARLAAALGSDCTVDCKRELCRRLRTMGTARSVPALAALLTDEALSHMARFALGYMQAPEALAALRDALGKTSGLWAGAASSVN